MDTLGLIAILALGSLLQVPLLIAGYLFVAPEFRARRIVRDIGGTYLGYLKSDRSVVLVLMSAPGEGQVLSVRPGKQLAVSYEDVWRMHQARDVWWEESGFSRFERAVRRNPENHEPLVAAFDERQREIERRAWPTAAVLAVVLLIVLYVETAVLHVKF